MKEQIVIRKPEDFKTSLWSGGSTTELFIYPEGAQYKEGNFQCRISSATVEVEKSDFTSLPGVKRYLSIFTGHLDMVHGEDQKVSLNPFEVDCFDGGIPTVSYGKVVDFNLMLKNGGDGTMETLKLGAGESASLSPKGGETLLVVYGAAGNTEIQGYSLKQQELLICKGWTGALEVKNTGDAEAGLGICRIRV